MTLSERNAFFIVGIVFCAVFTLLVLGASFFILPSFSKIGAAETETALAIQMEENTPRSSSFFQSITGRFLGVNYLAVYAAMVMSVLFSIISIIIIYSFFEQTSSPEILYIAFFTVSFSFEAIRLILPLHMIYNFPSFYLLLASRALLFARYFSIFSLFTASVCAAGLDVQKVRNIILILFVASLVITMGIPVDTQRWDTSFNMIKDNASIVRLIEVVVFITTIISFFIAVNVRGSKNYAYVGIGVMLAMIGRNILLNTDNWAGPVPGILLLSIGTWFVCSKLHKIYLWL